MSSLSEVGYVARFPQEWQRPGLDSIIYLHCRPAGEPEEVAADGVMLGYNSDLSHLVCPWAPAPNGPLINGSLHKERIFVEDARSRKLLLRFAHQK
jgi:hypothetical protein